MTTPSSKGTALVTGASSGIGAVYADRLARQGHDLLLVARRADKLAALADKIATQTGRSVKTLTADLASKEGNRKVEAVLRDDASIRLLVNNAGVGSLTPLVQTQVDDIERLIDLNVTSLTRLTYAAAPAFVARGGGTIINISSIVAIAPEMLNGVYGASKAYVLTLTQSLQHELGDKGLRVQAVLPGATATDFWSEAGMPVEQLPQEIVMSASAMVDAALDGLAKGEVVTIPSLHDGGKYIQYEALRRELGSLFGNDTPAPRYAA